MTITTAADRDGTRSVAAKYPDLAKGKTMNGVVSILTALPWFAWIPIVAIISGTVGTVTKMIITHNERMAMIRQGMNPDAVTAKPHEYSEV